MIHAARQTLAGSRPDFTYHVLDAQTIPFTDAAFDAVIINGTLCHLPDSRRGLAEIRRVLRPGGRMYASTGGRQHLQELEALVAPFQPGVDYGGSAERFGLENGSDRLSACFAGVSLYAFNDRLVFTEPQPIVDYVLSEGGVEVALSGERLAAFVQQVEQALAAQGSISVTIQKGLFAAGRPEDVGSG